MATRAFPGGQLKSKPTWRNPFGCSATSVFCCAMDFVRLVVRRIPEENMSSSPSKTFRRRLLIESLEEGRVLAAGLAEFLDPHPTIGDQFGALVVALSTGNVVITS